MRRTWRPGLVLLGVLGLVVTGGAPLVGAAPTPSTGDQSHPITRFTTTVTDTSRPTRCPSRGVDEPHRRLHVQVAHPTTGTGHPVLVFGHGMRGDPDLMVAELEGWARKGYVALAPRFPLSGRYAQHGWDCGWDDIPSNNGDLRFVLDQLAARAGDFARLPAELADTENVGASGISSGGIAVLLFFNDCCADPRIKAVDTQLAAPMLVPGGWRWGSLPIPLVMVNERDDPAVPIRFARAGWEAAVGPKHLVTLPGGVPHSSSIARPDTPPEVWELRERLFDLHLQGDADARSRLVHAFDHVPADYTYELDVPLIGSIPVTRVAGADRIATAIGAADQVWGPGDARGAVLARADDFPDALAGVPLADQVGGPLLLTPTDHLDARVRDHLRRVVAAGGTVHLLGGPGALSAAVADEVAALGFAVERHGGADRFDTAVRIADRLGNPDTVLLATGTAFPDALSAGGAAAEAGGVVLLTDGDRLPEATRRHLAAHEPAAVYAVGGPAAAAAPDAEPVTGADRYATSLAVARTFFADPDRAGVATGEQFPDALGAAAQLAATGSPLLLSPRAPLPDATRRYLSGVDHAYVYGGQLVVSESVRVAINEAAGT